MTKHFIIQVYGGKEHQAADGIKDLAKVAGQPFTAVAPIIRERRKVAFGMTWRQKADIRRRPVRETNLWPGYILSSFDPSHDWLPILRVRGVIRISPMSGLQPVPIPDAIAEQLVKRIDGDGCWIDEKAIRAEKPWIKLYGNVVRITDGPFTSFSGMCEMSSEERITVMVNMFGRKTPVELDWQQVELP